VPTISKVGIVEFLTDQHRQLALGCAAVTTANALHREREFQSFARLAYRHELGDRAVVHPVTRDRTGAEGVKVAQTCAAEEQHLAQALAKLADLGVAHPTFAEQFAAFHAALLEHCAHEERVEFPRLRRHVPAQRLHLMANEVRNIQTMS
jgi:hypothetical protein